MSRKRYPKKQPRPFIPAISPSNRKISPAAQQVANRIAQGGVEYMQDNLIRVLRDSVTLADEPEFLDLSFPRDQAVRVTDRWLQHYKKRLKAAEKKRPDALHAVSDEMRLQIVAELATPAFRQEVDHRLQTLLDRLMATDETEKLELVLFLKPMLTMKEFPWGLCGLILAIYTRTMQQTLQEFEEENEIFGEILASLTPTNDPVELLKAIETPEQKEHLGKKLAAKPGLRQRLENQIWEMVEAFEKELFDGKVILDLFSPEELFLPFHRIQEEFGTPDALLGVGDEEGVERTFTIIRETIHEILTPERLQRLRNEVQTLANTWLRAHHKWAAALQAELAWLDEDHYMENKFLLAAFLGQARRIGQAQKPKQKSRKR